MQKIEPSRKCLTRFLLDRLMFNIFKTTSCNSISVSSVVTVCTCDVTAGKKGEMEVCYQKLSSFQLTIAAMNWCLVD